MYSNGFIHRRDAEVAETAQRETELGHHPSEFGVPPSGGIVGRTPSQKQIMTERIFNFSAGPAVIPVPVLEEAQRDLLALPGVGMSVMESSHRSKTFD